MRRFVEAYPTFALFTAVCLVLMVLAAVLQAVGFLPGIEVR